VASSTEEGQKRSKSDEIFVSPDYLSCLEALPDVNVEFNFWHPINYKNISINSLAVQLAVLEQLAGNLQEEDRS
jgi:hypothetical protein